MMTIGRRTFLAAIAGSVLAAPLVAAAQQAGRVPRVGYLFYRSPGPSREIDVFRQGLRELGYIEGQSIAVEYRFASGQVERYPRLAAELVRMNVDVIVAPATPQALAAKQATRRIPVDKLPGHFIEVRLGLGGAGCAEGRSRRG